MGQSTDHALGRSRKTYVKAETTFGTQVKPAATDAFKTIKPVKFDVKLERADRSDSRNTRDVLERITRLKTVAWDFESYVLPSGTAGTAPGLDAFLKAGFGVSTNTPATSQAYTLNNVQAIGSLGITQHMNSVFQETAIGAWVEEISLKVSGKDEPKVAIKGGAKDYAHTGTSTSAGIVAAAATSFSVAAGDGRNFSVGSVFAGGADTNSGAGYLVTAVSTDTITFTPGAAVGWASAAAIVPYVPTETTVGAPVSFTLGSMTVDSVAVPVIDFDVTLKNNMKVFNDEAFNTTISDFIPGFREITGNFTIRGRKDEILNFGKRFSLSTRALSVVIGSVAGKKLTVSIPTAEIEFAAANIPDVDEIVLPFPFKAIGSSGEDSMTWTFT